MRIVWNCFSPALTDGNFLTGATGGNWMPPLFHFLETYGHTVHNVSVGESGWNSDVYDTTMLTRPDLIVLIWRWPMPDYPQRHAAYLRQTELLDYARDNKVPVLIHDEDLQGDAMLAAMILRKEYKIPVILSAPMIYPDHSYETLMFPWFESPKWTRTKTTDLTYIGNNYDRFQQVVDYVNPPLMDWKTIEFYGNWLDPSPHRETPDFVMERLPNVTFKGRLDQRDVGETLGKAYMTIHFAKEEYCKHGFLTLRWAEAITAGTIAIVPEEFHLPPKVKAIFTPFDFNEIKTNQWKYNEILKAQASFVYQAFSAYRWLHKMEELLQWS